MEVSAVSRVFKSIIVIGIISLFLLMGTQEAWATKKIYSPKVTKGEWEVELKAGIDFDDRASKDDKEKYKVAVGYGVTDWWFTEIQPEGEKAAGKNDYDITNIDWENVFQFTDDDAWLGVGLYLEYKLAIPDDEDDKIEAKLLFEKRLGDFKHTANVIFEKKVWNDADTELEGGFAWKTKYYWHEMFKPGFEYYGDFGELKDGTTTDEQSHQIGPVIYGDLLEGVEYEVGYLFGTTDGAPDGSLKVILEYEF